MSKSSISPAPDYTEENQTATNTASPFIATCRRLFVAPFMRFPVLRYLPSFFIPVFLLYFLYAAMMIRPFGEHTVLALDLNFQYVYYFEALRDWVYGEGSLLYSFSRSLGGEFLGIYAYYLSSPLSYIVALFPKEAIQEAIKLILLLKCGFSGLNFAIYLRKSVKTDWYATTLFSILYALCGYAVVMHSNTMWIDCFALLPLLALSIERLIVEGKYRALVIYLTIMLMSNYYIGYMVCLFCLAYFFFAYFRLSKEERNPEGIRFHFPRRLLRMGIFSIIALMISAILLIPAYYSLTFGKGSFSTPTWDFSILFPLYNLFVKFLFGSYDTIKYTEGIPFVYCGVIVLLLIPLFFLNRKISRREKICSGLIILFFILSFSINSLDLIWHAFQKPNWLNYRYSFLLVFLLLTMAAKAWQRRFSIKSGAVIVVGSVMILLTMFSLSFEIEYFSPTLTVGVSILLLLAYSVLIFFLTKNKSKAYTRTLSAALLVLVIIEIYASSLVHLQAFNQESAFSKYDGYNDFQTRFQGEVDYVKKTDGDFYRMEKLVSRASNHRNESYSLGYRGIGGSTSTLNSDTLDYLAAIGYRAESHWSHYPTFINPVADSLTGIRYVLGDGYSRIPTVFSEYHTNGDVTSYKNPFALSLAYVADNDVEHFTMNPRSPADVSELASAVTSSFFGTPFSTFSILRDAQKEDYVTHVSPFERLNNYVSKILGEEVRLFYPIEAVVETENVEVASGYLSYIKYSVIDTSAARGGRVHLKVSGVNPEDDIYLYVPSVYEKHVALYKDDVYLTSYFSEDTHGSFLVGALDVGETTTISLEIKNDDNFFYYAKDKATGAAAHAFYALDTDVYTDVFTRLAKGNYNITSTTEDSFDGTIETPHANATVLTTIPYDKGWIVTVDGQPVTTYETMDALLTFRIDEAGTHQLTMTYMPKEYKVAAVLCVSGLFLFCTIVTVDTLIKRRKTKKSVTPDRTEE